MACQPKLATRPPSPRLRWATFACISERRFVGLTRFELVTPRLSSVCSNQLSYRPVSTVQRAETEVPVLSKLNRTCLHFTCRAPDRSFQNRPSLRSRQSLERR